MGTQPALGILGGIFDPVHNGHLAAAQLAFDYFRLERVLFIPAGMPPHKIKTGVSAVHRLAMLKLSIAGQPQFSVWDGEMKRGGPSYTVDTLRILKEEFPATQLFFILGSDNLNEIQTWHNYRELFSLATICVAHRPGFPMKLTTREFPLSFEPFPSPEWKLSSTMLRGYLSKGYSCSGLMPRNVRDYIRTNKLYGV